LAYILLQYCNRNNVTHHVIGIANDRSIATGCAYAFYEGGSELAVT
jgi:enoyl-[acyl-carrier-protein] reductase (NADH)